MSTTTLASLMNDHTGLTSVYPGHNADRIAAFIGALGASPEDMNTQFDIGDLERAYSETGGDPTVDHDFDDDFDNEA